MSVSLLFSYVGIDNLNKRIDDRLSSNAQDTGKKKIKALLLHSPAIEYAGMGLLWWLNLARLMFSIRDLKKKMETLLQTYCFETAVTCVEAEEKSAYV